MMPCSEGQSKGCHVLKDNVNCKEFNEKKLKKLCYWCRGCVKMCLLMMTTICRVRVCPCCNSKLRALTHARTHISHTHTHHWHSFNKSNFLRTGKGGLQFFFDCFRSFPCAPLCLSQRNGHCSTGWVQQ